MTVDELLEKGAGRLEHASERLGSENGLKAKLREELAEDAAFLRKLKPSAIAARVHGERPPEDRAATPSPPERPVRPPRASGGPNPFVVIAAAFVVGYVLAKVVDWRGHAHPRIA